MNKGILKSTVLLVAILLLPITILAQDQADNQQKELERVKVKNSIKNGRRKFSSKKRGSHHNVQNDFAKRLIAFTLWRAVEEPDVEYPIRFERIDLDTPLSNKDRLRLTIEIPRPGYLYIIDSEQYKDEERNIKVVFPTLSINNGDNRILPTQPVGIPNIKDDPPFFTLNLKKDQLGENIRILITSNPIPLLESRDKPHFLSKTEFEDLKRWEVKVKKIELGEKKRLQSQRERDSEFGNEARKELEHNSPLPQSAFLALSDPGESIMVIVPLKLTTRK